MARVSRLVSFSEQFGILPEKLDELGVFDPLLNSDTPLFIDPLLVPFSQHPEISNDAAHLFREHFGNVITLMKKSVTPGDVADRSARQLLMFPEVAGICLGYGSASVSGSGSGPQLTDKLFRVTKDIVHLGYDDPSLFPVLALLEDGIGPDRISDMAATAIEGALYAFTQRVAQTLAVPTERHLTRKGQPYQLPTNPYGRGRKLPVILVPLDILRKLPIAKDWDGIMSAASQNSQLRHHVNTLIGQIFEARTKQEKQQARQMVRDAAMTNAEAFRTVVAMLDAVDKTPYDHTNDPDGHILWRRLARNIPSDVLDVTQARPLDQGEAHRVVGLIIDRFRFWLEDRRVASELWDRDGKPRPEKTAQRIFFMVAEEICRQRNLDINPETDSGGGPVDFKFSVGFSRRVLVEIKLSTNKKVVHGFTTQLEVYKAAEETVSAYYVVIDVSGYLDNIKKKLHETRDRFDFGGKRPSTVVFIDGMPRVSASHRKVAVPQLPFE
ncbi:hypothetical protein GALL_174210 [mine drainage metagenome]|uniref:Uncharacterized protein n=1 Tax=mine drainage metagenome TaxID=410659 RepID=A0A1J5SFT4_9ZZZZ